MNVNAAAPIAVRGGLVWDRAPTWRDPRAPFAVILACYVVLGITVLGFNRSPAQILLTVTSACLLDMALHYLLRGQRLLFPLSAAISGLSLAILVNYAHGPWLPMVPVFFAIASKYVLTWRGQHVFNPTLFAVVVCLKLGDGMFSAAPAYQWGGNSAMAAFVVTTALALFVFRIGRSALIVSFLGFYIVQLCLRAWLTRWHVPPETLFMGPLTSASFYLFTFFMITDPRTSPSSTRGQIGMAFSIVLVDMILHRFESLSTLFVAGFIYFSARFAWLHIKDRTPWRLGRAGVLLLAGFSGWLGHHALIAHDTVAPGFRLEEAAGIGGEKSDILERVDPRLAPVAKWLLSVGDAVAVADVDGDGLQDVFLTYPLKRSEDRAALYRNLGGFRFERVPIPALEVMAHNPETQGLPSGALWFDYDNDGDPDLLLMAGFGYTRLLENRGGEFIDVTRAAGIDEYTISLAANALDFNRDGHLDLILCNAMSPLLAGYDQPTLFNIFHLPAPEYPGDRRMVNVMHRTWHNADNGGGCVFYLGDGKRFYKQDGAKIGLNEHRWTLAIGTGDLNADGWTDLYLANDFGPDQLLLNRGGSRFESVRGRLVGEVGRDTYKGMNASIGDIDGDGRPDIYVSNVHEKLQAEGSLLWMNKPSGFRDEAMARNALNEHRFGWGAAMGDLDRDGRLDIVQANGMVDDSYDKRYNACPDYWYWNDKIALTGPDVHGYADRWADLRGRCIFPSERNRVYLNRGNHFVDVASQVGAGRPGNSRAVALADLDNRGRLDVLITHQFAPVSIYRNAAAWKDAAGWVGLLLEGDGKSCNRDALGTRVEVERQVREVQASNGFSAQGDRRLLFGLGDYHGDVTARIYWCGCTAAQVVKLPSGRYHRIRQGERL